jgi:L-fuconolactonase
MWHRPQWLQQVVENILEPERAIVDPHHHLWKPGPRGRYLLDDLLADTGSGHCVQQTVFIECGSEYLDSGPPAMRPVGETLFVVEAAKRAAKGPPGAVRIGGIVGFADLMLGAAVQDVLHAHLEAGAGLFRGIRHHASWDASEDVPNSRINPPPHLYSAAAFREGFACLAPLKLSFDAWNYHPQIPELTQLARAFPETTIVLNHFGGPLGIGPYSGRRREVFEQWRRDIAELSRCPNVFAKLGGLAMTISGFSWHERTRPPSSDELLETQRPYHLHTIEHFGIERCMFESNFPVERVSVSYAVLWNAFKKLAAGFSADEKEALFRGTAMRVYRLSPR